MISILKKINSLIIKIYHHFLFLGRNVSFVDLPSIQGYITIRGKGKLTLFSGIKINSSFGSNPVGLSFKTAFYIAKNAEISIGNNVGISNSLLYSYYKIVIEDNVMIGGGCQIYDTDFHSVEYKDRVFEGDTKVQSAQVIIKEGAFIGASSIILKGITIGERSIIGAGSVVTRSIPQDEIWAGNPAKFIRKIEN